MLKINPHLCSQMVSYVPSTEDLGNIIFLWEVGPPGRGESFTFFFRNSFCSTTFHSLCDLLASSSFSALTTLSLLATASAAACPAGCEYSGQFTSSLVAGFLQATHFYPLWQQPLCCLATLDSQPLPFCFLSGEQESICHPPQSALGEGIPLYRFTLPD